MILHVPRLQKISGPRIRLREFHHPRRSLPGNSSNEQHAVRSLCIDRASGQQQQGLGEGTSSRWKHGHVPGGLWWMSALGVLTMLSAVGTTGIAEWSHPSWSYPLNRDFWGVFNIRGRINGNIWEILEVCWCLLHDPTIGAMFPATSLIAVTSYHPEVQPSLWLG